MWNYIATAYLGALFGFLIAGMFAEPFLLCYLLVSAIIGVQQ